MAGFAFVGVLLFQLILGADPVVLLVALTTVMVGLWPLLKGYGQNLGGVLVFFFAANCVLWGIITKSVLLQPLDSNLHVPLESFAADLLSVLEFGGALFVVSHIGVGKPLLTPAYSTVRLTRLMHFNAFIGVGLWIGHRLLFTDARSNEFSRQADFGGLGVFQALLFFAIACATSRRLFISNMKSSVDFWVLSLLSISLAMLFLDNDKRDIVQAGLAYLLPTILIRRRISLAQIAMFALALAFTITILAPLTQQLRNQGIRRLSMSERIDTIQRVVPRLLSDSGRAQLESAAQNAGRRDNGNLYLDGKSLFVGRLITVAYDDPVIAATDRQGELGWWVLKTAVTTTLPSFLYPDKPAESLQDAVAWRLGLVGNGIISFPIVAITGMSYATAGWIGVLVIPSMIFLMLLLILKKIGWTLKDNVFSIFLLSQYIFSISNFTISQYMGLLFRTLPELVLVILITDMLARRLPSLRFGLTAFKN